MHKDYEKQGLIVVCVELVYGFTRVMPIPVEWHSRGHMKLVFQDPITVKEFNKTINDAVAHINVVEFYHDQNTMYVNDIPVYRPIYPVKVRYADREV